MKLKIAIIAASILVIILCIVLFIVTGKSGKKTDVFSDTDYPMSYQQDGGNLIVNLNGKESKELSWSYEVSDDTYVDVTLKGKEKNGKATFIISPKVCGIVHVIFTRKSEVADYSIDEVTIDFPIYVAETEEGLKVTHLEAAKQTQSSGGVIGEDTEFPVLLKTGENGMAIIKFVNGSNDWVVDPDPLGYVDMYGAIDDDGDFIYVVEKEYGFATSTDVEVASDGSAQEIVVAEETDPTGGQRVETKLKASSESLGVTGYIDVVVEADGTIYLTKGDAPK